MCVEVKTTVEKRPLKRPDMEVTKETDVRDEYNVYRNMANYYTACVAKMWNNDPETISAMKKIVKEQTAVANKLKALSTSLETNIKAPTPVEPNETPAVTPMTE